MEEGAHAHHHAHGTGLRWLDVSLALSAFVVSIASLWLTIHNARTMERLVAANSYPNIDVVSSNMVDLQDGLGLRPIMNLALRNTGIGPARLRTVEVSYGGRAAPGLGGLLALCCGTPSATVPPALDYWRPGELRGAMLQAGKEIALFSWPQTQADPRWLRLRAVALKIGVRVCYCSVFNECYLRDSEQPEPVATRSCPVPPTPWRAD